MADARSLLCIHRNPAELSMLREKGFSLITATHGSQGLRLLVSKPVDAVILEYYLGLLDGAAIADEIKRVRPRLPIVMLAESLELPEGALKSVDALVTRWDAKSPSCASIPSIFLNEAAMKARRLRARTTSGCKTVSIVNPPFF